MPVQLTDEWRAHALRVALGLRALPMDRQLELVCTWVEQALAIKRAVQKAERTAKARLRVRSSRGNAHAIADEMEKTRAGLWHAAHAAALPDGPERWPLTNPQHLVLSAGMFDLTARTKSFGALHVGVLALAALGHQHAAIARALGGRDPAQVRSTLRQAGEISLSQLFAQ